MTKSPTFSIVHPSARPEQWKTIYDAWMAACANPGDVEYILCADSRWNFQEAFGTISQPDGSVFRQVMNRGRRCYVDAVNTAARVAAGQILIVIADDQYPCADWDIELMRALSSAQQHVGDSFVIEVSTGTVKEHERGIIVMPVLSRSYYEALGGSVFYPEFESMYADNDFCAQARHDGVVLDARHLMFPHRHFLNTADVQIDDAYRAQNRPEAFKLGEQIYARRLATEFGNKPAIPLIAFCLLGERFEGTWVDSFFTLYDHIALRKGWNTIRARGEITYTSNVYITREEIRQSLLTFTPHPDYVLWLDDDNTLTPEQFDKLVADLEEHPEADAVFAWCWIHDESKTRFQVSCGTFAPDGAHWQPFHPSFANSRELRSVEASGFPCVLMRWSCIEKAGEQPFIRGILDGRLQHGIGGEDLAFCRAAAEGGATMLVDPTVRVEHLKYVAVQPVFPEEGKEPVRIATMLRVKNESRWIARVVDSVKELGPVFVMDDGSSDDTREIARHHGARVLLSPFVGEALDEARDKEWLRAFVREECGCDWILCIDGDEELQRGGAEKILRACESGVADVFALRFLYLWDRPYTARFDRWYSTFTRLSLFRADVPGMQFKSLYAENGVQCHSGLHTGNAPLGDDNRQATGAALNVFLLHYGYMLKADRLRKYEYYNRIDPGNETEDCYRHMVQGDIPEVPADARLRHAGPLELRILPGSIRPHDFDYEALAVGAPQ